MNDRVDPMGEVFTWDGMPYITLNRGKNFYAETAVTGSILRFSGGVTGFSGCEGWHRARARCLKLTFYGNGN